MKWAWKYLLFVSMGLAPRMAGAQSLDTSSASLANATAVAAPSLGQHEVLMSFVLVATTILLLLVIGKASDLRRRREEEQMDLEARIGSALLEHAAFVHSSVGSTVRIPFWRGSPVTVKMVGKVPSAQLEQSALRIAAQAASRVRSDVALENHMVVVQTSNTRAAGAKGEPQMAHRLVGVLKTVTTVVGVLAGVALLKYAILIEHLNLH